MKVLVCSTKESMVNTRGFTDPEFVFFPPKNVEKIELLPYHSLGDHKYEELKIYNPLKNTSDMDINKCLELEKILKED